MRTLSAIFVLLTLSFAQDNVPATTSTLRWDASAPGATKETQPGRIQKNVTSSSATVSALAEVSSARRFIQPPMDGGYEVVCIVIGIRNTSQQAIHIDPSRITLRVAGKKEQQLKQLQEEQVLARAWMGPERGGSAVSTVGMTPGTSMGATGAGDAALDAAVIGRDTFGSSRKAREAAEQQTGPQIAKLKERALIARDLAPGEAIQGLMFFMPYGEKDNVELSVPVGDTTFVVPFSGRKAKK